MSLVNVRNAKITDANAIQVLYQELVNNPAVSVLPERIAEIEKNVNSSLFVGEKDGEVVGTVLVSLCLDVMFGYQPFAVVENIIVTASCRGLGVGTELMRAVEQYSNSAHCSKIMLLSSAERVEAHDFFENVGFIGSSKKGFVKYRRHFTV
ncbi:GNAT family N-acetyltransferase [Deefgea piscis]|uniref:GNAT family N-acetyltransferase n=1 Tax=Deefgea piscis TaxID=2739061 RepID=A0A6M8SPS3_9NEIS|nr:GNAT family N-acetyltransferase [Deefgea piscis]QKJ67205.1 GNAT family N-acetyltransferase [Deefgea piscis]